MFKKTSRKSNQTPPRETEVAKALLTLERMGGYHQRAQGMGRPAGNPNPVFRPTQPKPRNAKPQKPVARNAVLTSFTSAGEMELVLVDPPPPSSGKRRLIAYRLLQMEIMSACARPAVVNVTCDGTSQQVLVPPAGKATTNFSPTTVCGQPIVVHFFVDNNVVDEFWLTCKYSYTLSEVW